MRGVMTEQKLTGIVKDLLRERFGSNVDPDYRAGFCAGFHELPSPCAFKQSIMCAEGFLAGQNVRATFLSFHGGTTDDIAVAMVRAAMDPDAGERIPKEVYAQARWGLQGFCATRRVTRRPARLIPGVTLEPLPLTT